MTCVILVGVYQTDEAVYDSFKKYLFNLLKQRREYQSISHKKMPMWEDHSTFVDSKPYKFWYILQNNRGTNIGMCYVTNQNEIGIFIDYKYKGMGFGRETLEVIFNAHIDIEIFYANIGPRNSHSIAFFINRGWVYQKALIINNSIKQYTYAKNNPNFNACPDEESEKGEKDSVQDSA